MGPPSSGSPRGKGTLGGGKASGGRLLQLGHLIVRHGGWGVYVTYGHFFFFFSKRHVSIMLQSDDSTNLVKYARLILLALNSDSKVGHCIVGWKNTNEK